MAVNVKLVKRFKRSNVKGRRAYYWPRAISAQKKLEPGTEVLCVDDAKGINPKLVTVMERKIAAGKISEELFVVLLEDLAE